MTNISVVITILNEEESIEKLLKALISQTKKPLEIIFIDAGSKDKTAEIIRKYQEKYDNLKIIVKPGINRSQGRNMGIKKARGKYIAITDAGCIPEKGWLKKISGPFKDKSIEVVSGFYKPSGNSIFQRSLAVYTSLMPHKIKSNKFLPASRSMAITKSIWKKAGGFPEELDTCEDRIFVERLKKINAKFMFKKDAIVHWEQKKTFKEAFWQLHGYARGDLLANYQPHVKKIVFVWIRYLIVFWFAPFFPWVMLFFAIQYLGWVIGKGYPYVKDKRALIYLPLLQLTSDLAVMSGSIAGYIERRKAPSVIK